MFDDAAFIPVKIAVVAIIVGVMAMRRWIRRVGR